ncbi:MAG TPA: hypothetical protein DEX20_12530 [Halieaceae bacterium]|nr:hypothetical protein [Halieaceae bacterium]
MLHGIFCGPDIASARGCAILAHRAARTESPADDAFFRVMEENFWRSGRVLTEQSKIAEVRPSHEGDPKGETRSVE